MKKMLLISLLTLSAGLIFAIGVRGSEGVVLKEQKQKTNVYAIHVVGIQQTAQAQLLDRTMLTKHLVVSSSTDISSGICTVEVLKEMTPELLIEVVEYAGFNVAKSSEQ